jgi:uncharacterized protein
VIEPLTARWATVDGSSQATVELRFENGGWTADGDVTGEPEQDTCTYVLRFGPGFDLRQFLLFRDLDEPDLWLATDGAGNWGEMNGAHRPELRGCTDIEVAGTPFSTAGPIRRLGLGVGDAADVLVAQVDVETLDVRPVLRRFERIADRRWRLEERYDRPGVFEELVVDEHGLAISHVDRFHRLA